MKRFAAAVSEHPVTATAVGETAGHVLEALGTGADLVLLFVTPHHAGALEDAAGAVRAVLDPACLIGCAAEAVVGDGREIEGAAGVSLWAGRVGPVEPLHLEMVPIGAEGRGALLGWPEVLTFDPSLLVLLADPFSFPADPVFEWLTARHPGLPVIGGNASAARGPGGNRLTVNGESVTSGAVGALVGSRSVEAVVSQGCRAIGQPFVVTKAERNVIYEIGGRPAYERLMDAVHHLPEGERGLVASGVFIGVVVDEHRAEYQRGDFLVRNVLGADKAIGAIAVNDDVDVGTTVQYHVRDAVTADEDLRAVLRGREADAALLFTCNGRGRRLFAEPDHDAGVVADVFGRAPTAGFFAAGEFGPVGRRNFTHGFTAALALLRDE